MKRRDLIVGLAALAAAGCSTTAATTTPTIRDAQNWASSVVAALSELGSGLIADGSLSGENAATVEALINGAQAALAVFVGLQPGATSAPVVAGKILAAIQTLIPLLPLDPGTRSAVQLGISVLGAFIQNIPMTVPDVPATLHTLAEPHDRCTPV